MSLSGIFLSEQNAPNFGQAQDLTTHVLAGNSAETSAGTAAAAPSISIKHQASGF